jgi:dTDP-glucose 4,6-dehydratase
MIPLPEEDLRYVLEHTTLAWKKWPRSRFFLTGGTGFFGRWLVESFLWANEQLGLESELTILTRNPEKFLAEMPHLDDRKGLKLHRGDVRNFDFPVGDFKGVIHAGNTSSSPVAPLEMFDTIVEGTRRTLDFALEKKVQSFLFVSSGAVYGRQPENLEKIPEDYNGAPLMDDSRSAYGEGKRSAELLCTMYHQANGVPAKVCRCFAFLGPHLPLDAHFAIGNFIRDALNGGNIRIQGDGTALRSYMYAADLSVDLWRQFLEGSPGQCLNLGSDEAFSMAELAGRVAAVINPEAVIEICGSPHGGPVHRYVPDCTRSRKKLGAREIIPLSDAIRRTAVWVSLAEKVDRKKLKS